MSEVEGQLTFSSFFIPACNTGAVNRRGETRSIRSCLAMDEDWLR